MPVHNIMINSLQSLRGIFAILIFMSHYSLQNGERLFYPGGTSGVEYFIVLSGFVLCAGYEKAIRTKTITFKNFMVRRLIRIYPLHLACLCAWMFLHRNDLFQHILEIISNIFLIQSWFPDENIYYGCNTPSWCLSVFLFLYLCFPLLIALWHKNSRRFLHVAYLVVILYIIYLIILPVSVDNVWASRIFPPLRLIDFSLGIILWHLYTKLRDGGWGKIQPGEQDTPARITLYTLIELIPIALFAISAAVSELIPDKWCGEVIWWIPITAFIMIFAIMNERGGLLSRMLKLKSLVIFGNASFCFYLIHILVISVVNRLKLFHGLNLEAVPELMLTFGSAVIISLIAYFLFDRPISRWLKRKLKV